MLKYNMNNFNKVLITNIHDRTTRYECNNIEGYKSIYAQILIWLKLLENITNK
jgi:hypothetical protein